MISRASLSAAVVAFLLLLIAGALPAAAQPFVYGVTSAPSVNVTNVSTGQIIAGVTFGAPGDYAPALALSPDASRIYAVRHVGGVSGPGVLTIIDAVSLSIVREVNVGMGPSDVAVTPGGAVAYVTNSGSNTVSVVDLASVAVIKDIPVGSFPRHVVVSPDGASVYVTNYLDHSISKISAASNAVTATIALSATSNPISASFSPDGSHLFVANTGSPAASVANVDVATGTVVGYVTAAAFGDAKDVVAASATRVFASFRDSSIGGDTGVAVIDPSTNSRVQTISVPGAGAMAMDSSRTHLFVSGGSGMVVIDAQTLAQRDIPLAGGGELAVTPDTTPCLFEVTPAMGFVPAAGGSGQFTIPAPAGCSWTVRPTDSAIMFDGPLTGVGPATLTYHVHETTRRKRIDVVIDRQVVSVDQTVPVPSADVAGGVTVGQPLHVGLWFDRDFTRRFFPRPGSPVDVMHTWAFPASGGNPVFVGEAFFSFRGLTSGNSGFNVPVGNLPAGRYTLVFYAHDPLTGGFQAAAFLDVTVRSGRAAIVVDTPRPGATVISPFVIGGWAVDPAAAARGGSGIDVLHIWAYPASGGAARFVAQAFVGGSRPDIGRLMGSPFSRSGFTTTGSLPSGSYTLVLFGRSTATNTFSVVETVPITVIEPQPLMSVDYPQACPCTINGGLFIQGWALDLAAPSGTGVSQMEVWAFPVGGGAAFFVDNPQFVSRSDVAQAFGPQFQQSGFRLSRIIPAGAYDIVIYARSTLTGTVNNSRTIRVTIQF